MPSPIFCGIACRFSFGTDGTSYILYLPVSRVRRAEAAVRCTVRRVFSRSHAPLEDRCRRVPNLCFLVSFFFVCLFGVLILVFVPLKSLFKLSGLASLCAWVFSHFFLKSTTEVSRLFFNSPYRLFKKMKKYYSY